MGTVLLVLVVVLVIAGLVYGVVTLLAGEDPGLSPVDPDGRARPLPNNRSLTEYDLKAVLFDTGVRGYRMSQVDRVLRRTAYDIGYKDEMIAVLEAEVIALREGRAEDAELLRKAREAAAAPPPPPPPVAGRAPGAHRVDSDAEVLSNDDDDAEVLPNDDPPEPDPDPDDPTAPGLLNRAALRQIDLSTSDSTSTSTSEAPGAAETGAESGPPGGSEAGGSDASDVSETETETEAAGTGAREADPATEAERRART